jgi:hypothetical protein
MGTKYLIDAEQSNVDIWIVWSLSKSHNIVINAICLTPGRALQYKQTLDAEDSPVRVYTKIEKTQANHLFAELFHVRSE